MTSLPLLNRLRAVLGHGHRKKVRRYRERFLKAARKDCDRQQTRVLQRLLKLNEGTQFSADFGLRPGMTVAEFQRHIPIADFDLVRPYVERVSQGQHSALLGRHNKLLMFAVTSGTTADSKLIPVTRRFVRDYRRGWQSWGIGLYFDYPQLQPLNMVQIASSHRRFHTADGTPCGSISGLVVAMQSHIIRSMYSVPASTADIPDPEIKRYAALKYAVEDPFVGIVVTANPSTILQMLELLDAQAESVIRDIHDGTLRGFAGVAADGISRKLERRPNPRRAAELTRILTTHGQLKPAVVWPQLVALGVWCGGSAAAYLPRLRSSFPGIVIRDHGLHASEGRMTMPLQNDSSAGVLEIQTHFFEFIPVAEADSSAPVTLLAHELKEGSEYFVLLTTSSGLYRYHIRDVVRCQGFYGTTPLLEFLHKGAHISSITGEKIAESQVVEAVQSVARELGVVLRLYTLTPEWCDIPGYVLYLDAISPSLQEEAALVSFSSQVDRRLCELNVEYREKRETGRLSSIRSELLCRTRWDAFTKSRTQRSGGSLEQYKHPCLLPDPQFENLFRMACQLSSGPAATNAGETQYR